MKIGLYSPYLDTLAGGEKYMLTLAVSLAQKNHTVTLFWDPAEKEKLQKGTKEKFNIDLSAISLAPNLFDKKISFFSRLQKTKEYDRIIILSDGSIPFVSSKLILHFQTPMPWIHPTLKTTFKLKRVANVICNSYFTKKFIDKEFGITSSVIYPPVSIEKKHEKKENIILHVGRFGISNAGSSAKKQEFMAQTFKTMVDNGLKNWKLIFIISYKDITKESIDTLKKDIAGYPVELVENPTNNLLWDSYGKAKIYWHASGFGEDLEAYPGRAEHFGMSTVEAMGCGAVPVVINAGGQPEIVEDGKNGLLWNTQEELIEKTKKVIDDTWLWEKLSQEAKKRAEIFSVETFSNKWEKAIV